MSPSAPEDRSKWSPARLAHQRRVSEAHERAAERANREVAMDQVAHETLHARDAALAEVRKLRQDLDRTGRDLALADGEPRRGLPRRDLSLPPLRDGSGSGCGRPGSR
jgi:hypothetical protein